VARAGRGPRGDPARVRAGVDLSRSCRLTFDGPRGLRAVTLAVRPGTAPASSWRRTVSGRCGKPVRIGAKRLVVADGEPVAALGAGRRL
jgi:hypothetical protein